MPEDAGSPIGAGSGTPPSNPGTPVPAPAQPLPPRLETFPVAVLIILHFLTCGIFSLVWVNLMHGKLPRVRPDDPSAGKAVGFCFIPFYNLYWIFFTYRRLALRMDEYRAVFALPPSNLRGMATANCVFQVIPYINALIGYTIITPVFIGLTQASFNELARASATTRPRTTLSTTDTPAAGMPGWAIALIVCGCLIPFILGLFAAMLLPTLARAKMKAQQISCVSNMKQIGLAFRIWENDHGDQFPFNVSTNKKGTLEWCLPGPDGFDQNSWHHLQAMSNELGGSTRILVCPADGDAVPAVDFSHLEAHNVTYRIHSGANVTDANPQVVLAICPLHHTVLLADGSVQQMSASGMSNFLARPGAMGR